MALRLGVPPRVARLGLPDAELTAVARALADFAPTVAALPGRMREAGVYDAVIEACRRAIDGQAGQLQRLAD